MTQIFYKASKHKFDNDPEFKARAQQGVVRLQVCIILDVDSGKVDIFSSKRCIICREGRKNIEKHGKRFVTLAGANLTWSTSV